MNFRWTILALALLAGCARFQSQPLSPAQTAAGLDARTLDNPAFRAFLEKNLSRRFDAWPPKSWDFDMLSLAALYYHPSLDVARADWQVALAGEQTAGARPNPTLTVTPGYDFNPTGISPWLPSVDFDLPIETAGKRGYRQAQAKHLSESARFDIAAAAWRVRSQLRSSLIDYTAAHRREALLQDQKNVQEKIVQSLEQQLAAGAVSSSEVGLVKIALAKIQLDLADARRAAVDARSHLAEAIGLPVKALAGVEPAFDLSVDSPPAIAELASAAVRDQALQSRADILGALADYAASQSALQLEIARQYPDIHLGPGYQYDHGEHTFTLALTAELPIFNQNQGPIAEAKARRAATAARFLELQAKVIAEIDRAVAAWQVTRENLAMLESLGAAQKKQSDAVAAQAQAGAAAQIDVLNARLELSAGELAQLDGRVKLQESLAALEDAVQRPIDAMKPSLIEQGRSLPTKEKQP